MDDTSASLLKRLAQGDDRAAWSRFVDLYGPLLHTWAVRTGLQPADAADLVQDVLLTVLQQLPSFRYDPSRSFRSWLKTVTLNHWRARRRRLEPLDRAEQDEPAVADPAADFWEKEYRAWLTARALHLMQAHFEPRVWQACWLTAAEGRPATEVATQLGMTVGAVYTARCRVLARLRQELDGFDI